MVAPGTQLVGTVFPVLYGRAATQWQALLMIDNDPLGVYDAYVAQARALGFPLPGSGATGARAPSPCQYYSSQGDGYPLEDPRGPTAASFLDCGSGAQRQTASGADEVQVEMRWGGANHHVALTFTMNVAAVCNAPTSCPTDPGDTKAGAVYIPPAGTTNTARVRPGDRFGPVFNGFDGARESSRYDRLRLERGTRVAASADRIGLVVLRVEGGDVQSVLRRYGRQMGKTHVKYLRWKGARVPYVENSPGDGGYGTLNADPSGKWILIRTGSD